MLGEKTAGILDHGSGELPGNQVEALIQGGDDGGDHFGVVEARCAIGQCARSARVPIELERPVDRDEDVADPFAVVDDHDTADMSRSPDQTLADPHHLDPASYVHRPLTRAVLAGELSDPGIDPEFVEGFDHDVGDGFEPFLDPGPRFGVR